MKLQDCRMAGLQEGKGKDAIALSPSVVPFCNPAILQSCNPVIL